MKRSWNGKASFAGFDEMADVETSGSEDANKDEMATKKQIIVAALSLLMESETMSAESDDDEEERLILEHLRRSDDIALFLGEKMTNCASEFIEKVPASYTEEEFLENFRISRSLFESLTQRFADSENFKSLREDKRLPADVHLFVFLWFAGHDDCSYRDLAQRFDMCLSSVQRVIKRVTIFISSLSLDVIKWPNQQEKQATSKYFSENWLFPKAIGCIDVTHIQIDPPKTSKEDYINRGGTTSVCLQGICNEHKKFINIFVGLPGSCEDSWVFKNSSIYENLPTYCGDFYLLGDSAYPCNEFLITPYNCRRNLTEVQETFNDNLSSGHFAIRQAFVLLKQRFRQLRHCKLKEMEQICHFIRACCVLHNLAKEDDLKFSSETTLDDNGFEGHREMGRGNHVRDSICEEMELPSKTIVWHVSYSTDED